MKEDSNKLKEYLVDCFGLWKYVDPELVARVIPSSEWVEIPEGAEEYYDNKYPSCCFFLKRLGSERLYSFVDKKEWKLWGNFEDEDLSMFELKWKREQETVNPINRNEFNPLIPQEGGDHYKLRPIQPIEYSERNGLSMSQGNIVKYITRHKEKNGIEDLAKVVHYALLEAYFVYDVKGSTELKQRILKMLGD